MERKSYTIILVPHARAKFRKLQISRLQIRALAVVLAAFGLATGYVTWSYFTTSVDPSQVEALRDENAKLREVNLSFEQGITQLQAELETYEERTRQLAIVAGLDEVSGSQSGLGGTFADGDGIEGVSFLRQRLEELSLDLGQVETKLDERFRWVSSMPAITPTRGLLTSGFGMRTDPIHGRRAFHQGLDISARPRTPVYAPADGLVLRAGRIGQLGNAVYLSHGYGLTTRFGHLASLDVEPGDRFRRGEVIGSVGNTGRSTGYHLHYEVHVDGKPVNPLAYLLDRPTRAP